MNNKQYGEYGGQYVAESLMNTLKELETAYREAIKDPEFIREYKYYLKDYVGRETPLYLAEKLSEKYGTKIYLKREDLNHTGAHKINNVIGQILLAKRMGKKKVIAETGAGQHGVATATGAALFGMECTVYMGEEDMARQALNVFRMEMLGARVECVKTGSRTLKDATNEAIRTWAKNAEDTFYIIGSAVGPHPYPEMVKQFQRSSVWKLKSRFWKKKAGCRTASSPVWAAAPIPLECSRNLLMKKMCSSSAWKPPAAVSRPGNMPAHFLWDRRRSSRYAFVPAAG